MNNRALLVTFIIGLSLLTACINTASKLAETGDPVLYAAPTTIESKPPTQKSTAAPLLKEQPANSDLGILSSVLPMNAAHAAHTATLLPDGRVLITGGFREEGTSEIAIANAEIFDPETNSFIPTGDLHEARSSHTATLLPNGLVLIVGGWGVNGRLASAELYDPQRGEFRYAASLSAPRASMTATLLENGLVLIAGGDSARNTPQFASEIYDPAADTFLPGPNLNQGRSAHTATVLNDGRVLLSGGRANNDQVLAGAEIYDPQTGAFTLTGSMATPRHKHAALLLADGNVLLLGGSNQNDWDGQYSSAEIYDSSSGSFSATADLHSARFKMADAVVLLDNGNVFVGGGNKQVELYDTQNQQFIPAGELDKTYFYSVATRLQDGRVLITGGYDTSIQPSNKAWLYR